MANYAVTQRAYQIDDSLQHGEKNVAVAGTAECLVSESTPCTEVLIVAKTNNTDVLWWGGVNVPNNATGGVPLNPGDAVRIQTPNLNKIYLNVVVNGEGVTYSYWRTAP